MGRAARSDPSPCLGRWALGWKGAGAVCTRVLAYHVRTGGKRAGHARVRHAWRLVHVGPPHGALAAAGGGLRREAHLQLLRAEEEAERLRVLLGVVLLVRVRDGACAQRGPRKSR